MKVSHETSLFCVVDDFLSEGDHEEVWKYLQAETFTYVNAVHFNGAWRLDDGMVMRGPLTSFGPFENRELKYPCGRPVDLVMGAILKHGKDFRKWIGDQDKDWNAFTALPMLYPAGSSLFWHRDALVWSGSYTYYAHKVWNAEWAGELLVASEDLLKVPDNYGVFMKPERPLMGAKTAYSFGAHLDNSEANEFLMKEGVGSYVAPKPNRLVILKSGAVHRVSKVSPAAGGNVRASISGFFQRPKA